MTTPLDVDGPRPAVTWVSSLPRGWTDPRERLVLMLLASDTYDRTPPFECSPSLDQLAAWAGDWKGSVADALTSLMHPTERRPALIEKHPGKGRKRTVYVLLTDTSWAALAPAHADEDVPLWSGDTDHDDAGSQSGSPDHYDPPQAGDNPRSGRRSSRASGRTSGRGAPTTPLSLPLPTQPTSVEDPTQTARDELAAARARRAAGGTR